MFAFNIRGVHSLYKKLIKYVVYERNYKLNHKIILTKRNTKYLHTVKQTSGNHERGLCIIFFCHN